MLGILAMVAPVAAGCGGRLKDDLPPLPPPSVPRIVPVRTSEPVASPAPRPVPSTPPAPVVPPPAPAAPPPAPEPAPEPALRCALTGRVPVPRDTPIRSDRGRVIARFTGAEVTVTTTELTLATPPRARLETGTARGSFRIRGLVEAAKLPVVTAAPLAVAVGHLWIGERRAVAVTAVNPARVQVQRAASPPLNGTFSASTTCDGLSLDARPPPGWSPPGDARGYALRESSLELFAAPGGRSVGMLTKAPGPDAVLFFGGEERDGFVHVERHADLVVDAWARAASLSPLPRGETLDELAPATTTSVSARVALAGVPRSVRTAREVPLRAVARDAEPTIGSIAPDTETVVVDEMAGWVSVLPKTLELIAAEGGHLWAKKGDLGL